MPGENSSRWNWLEDIIIPAISAAMYAAWLTPLLRALLGSFLVYPRDKAYPWWAIVVVLLVAGTLARSLAGRRGERWITAGVGALVVIGSAAAVQPGVSWRPAWSFLLPLVDLSEGFPASLVALLTTLGLWFGGARVNWLRYKQLLRGFTAGILVLAILSLSLPNAVRGEDLVGFLLTGLLALALLTVASHLAYQAERGLPQPPLSRYWLMALGLAMLGILTVGWILSLFLAPEAVASVLARLRPLLGYLGDLIAFIGAAILWLLYLGLQLIGRLFERGVPQEPTYEEGFRPPAFERPELELAPGAPPGLPEGLGPVLIGLLLATLLIIVLVYSWRSRSKPRRTSSALEEREFVWSKELLLERWRGLFDSLSRPRPRELFGDTLDPNDPRHRIREAYRLLLLNARERGLPRLRGQTVTAYRDTVAASEPATQAPLAILSSAYLDARYGDAEPPTEMADQAQQASQAAAGHLVQPRRVRRS